MERLKVECFNGETGYLNNDTLQSVSLIKLRGVKYLVLDSEFDVNSKGAVYKLIKDDIESHIAIVESVKDYSITKKVLSKHLLNKERVLDDVLEFDGFEDISFGEENISCNVRPKSRF